MTETPEEEVIFKFLEDYECTKRGVAECKDRPKKK